MYLRIPNWFGRLGNNLIQVRHVIQVALYHKHNIILPPHNYFNKTRIFLFKDSNKNIYIDKEGSNFFYSFKIKKFNKECFVSNISRTKEIMQDLFKIKYQNLILKGEKDLVIHIRGGDIFNNNPPNYLPPPLKFYIDIIEKNDFINIYLVSDDKKNPCINKLIEKYPNIKFKLDNLDNDIKIILSAQNIVSSIGTFIPSLLFVTNYTKKVFYPSYSKQVKEVIVYQPEIFHSYDLTDYENKNKKWINNCNQRDLLLTYSI